MPSFAARRYWYDERRSGLGDEFIAEVSTVLERVGDAAESFPVWRGTRAGDAVIRKATVQRFPYEIAFEKQLELLQDPRSARSPN